MAAQTYQGKFLQEGNVIDHTPGSAVGAGDVVVQNSLVGIAKVDIAANALGALAVSGIFDVVKVTGGITAGVACYWDATGDPVGGTSGTGAITTTAGGNTFAGYAVLTAASGDAVVRLFLVAVTNITVQELTTIIADPGDAGAIPVTSGGHVPLVSGGSETRTLADPTVMGQTLLLAVKTDGGTIVITAATAINQAGNNTITMAEVDDMIALVAIESGAGLKWKVLASDGAALSTV